MAIKSIKATLGADGVHGTVFLGGATALELLGETSATVSVPATWKKMLDAFLKCGSNESISLGKNTIVKDGFYVKVKDLPFTETKHGSKGPAYWEIAENVEKLDKIKLAAQIRALLENPDGEKCDPWVATLTAAMFLSEVARNPRSFIINLMLLDLIEGKVKYGKPELLKELDFKKLLVYDGNKSTYKYRHEDAVRVDELGKEHSDGTMRGGKLPMSHKGAMEDYKKTSEPNYDGDFDACAKTSKLNLKAPSGADVAYHFPTPLLEKECTILLRWIVAFAEKNPLAIEARLSAGEKPAAWGAAGKVAAFENKRVTASLFGLKEHVRKDEWLDAADRGLHAVSAASLRRSVLYVLKIRQCSLSALL